MSEDYNDLISLLKNNGYGVVEGKEAVLKKIDEMAENERSRNLGSS